MTAHSGLSFRTMMLLVNTLSKFTVDNRNKLFTETRCIFIPLVNNYNKNLPENENTTFEDRILVFSGQVLNYNDLYFLK